MKNGSVLIIDDDRDAAATLIEALRGAGLAGAFYSANDPDAALACAAQARPEVAVLDLCLDAARGVESGFALLRSLLERDATCRVIVLTGHGSIEHGVRCIDSGAASFVEKPADIPHLRALIKDGIGQAQLKRAYHEICVRTGENELEGLIVGKSRAIAAVVEAVRYAAHTSQAVLITGETGTGKGLCAAAIHRLSPRRTHRFVRLQPHFGNPDLVQSDLFGHAAGAFTGAGGERRGLLSEAQGGTVFLDEVDELPAATQVTLLGVLQDKQFRPLGANREQEIDIRLIAASNQDIEQCLASGKLRRDFYHRIAHCTIDLPALRERKEDIPLLAETVLRRVREREQLPVFGIDELALDALQGYDWPGNVRELEAVVEGAAYKANYARRVAIGRPDLSLPAGGAGAGEFDLHASVRRFKQQAVHAALARCAGNQVRAAKTLGIDRATLRRILAETAGDGRK